MKICFYRESQSLSVHNCYCSSYTIGPRPCWPSSMLALAHIGPRPPLSTLALVLHHWVFLVHPCGPCHSSSLVGLQHTLLALVPLPTHPLMGSALVMQRPGRGPLPYPYRETALCTRVFRTVQPGVPLLKERDVRRPCQYKLWDVDKLERACADARKGLSIRRAELLYGIPKSTIHDYANGNHMIGKPGHRRYLFNDEESSSVSYWMC